VKVLELSADSADLLATVRWIDERQFPGMYLRQVDVPGVDTKFIGRHRGVLTELLDLLTPDEQALYGALGAGVFGPAVRLEQERISFAVIAQAVAHSDG
jgi:hypothetical protein